MAKSREEVISKAQAAELREQLSLLFDAADDEGNELLDFEEFGEFLVQLGFETVEDTASAERSPMSITNAQKLELFKKLDFDNSGGIHYTEMLDSTRFNDFLREVLHIKIEDGAKHALKLKRSQAKLTSRKTRRRLSLSKSVGAEADLSYAGAFQSADGLLGVPGLATKPPLGKTDSAGSVSVSHRRASTVALEVLSHIGHVKDRMYTLFKEGDVNGDGVVDSVEFQAIMRKILPTATDSEVSELFLILDVKGTGNIDYTDSGFGDEGGPVEAFSDYISSMFVTKLQSSILDDWNVHSVFYGDEIQSIEELLRESEEVMGRVAAAGVMDERDLAVVASLQSMISHFQVYAEQTAIPLHREMESMQYELEEARQSSALLEVKCDEMKRELEHTSADLSAENALLSSERDSFKEQIDRLLAENRSLHIQGKLDERLDSSTDHIADLQSENAALVEMQDELEGLLKARESELTSTMDKLAQRDIEIEDMRQLLLATKNLNEGLSQEHAAMSLRLEGRDSTIDIMAIKMVQIEDEMAEFDRTGKRPKRKGGHKRSSLSEGSHVRVSSSGDLNPLSRLAVQRTLREDGDGITDLGELRLRDFDSAKTADSDSVDYEDEEIALLGTDDDEDDSVHNMVALPSVDSTAKLQALHKEYKARIAGMESATVQLHADLEKERHRFAQAKDALKRQNASEFLKLEELWKAETQSAVDAMAAKATMAEAKWHEKGTATLAHISSLKAANNEANGKLHALRQKLDASTEEHSIELAAVKRFYQAEIGKILEEMGVKMAELRGAEATEEQWKQKLEKRSAELRSEMEETRDEMLQSVREAEAEKGEMEAERLRAEMQELSEHIAALVELLDKDDAALEMLAEECERLKNELQKANAKEEEVFDTAKTVEIASDALLISPKPTEAGSKEVMSDSIVVAEETEEEPSCLCWCFGLHIL